MPLLNCARNSWKNATSIRFWTFLPVYSRPVSRPSSSFEPTQKVWFYQLNLDRTLGKTDPLNENDLADFVEKQKTKPDSENSWSVNVADLDDNYDLSVKNPNKVEVVDERTPQQIAAEIEALAADSQRLLNEIMEML